MFRRKIDEAEADTLRKIKESQYYKDIAMNFESLNEQCDEELIHLMGEQKLELDRKSHQQQYSYIVLKEKYYEELIEFIRLLNSELKTEHETTKDQFEQLISMQIDEGSMKEGIKELLTKGLKIAQSLDEYKPQNP